MAGIPARAPGCEAALTGQPWTEETVEAAAQALARGLSRRSTTCAAPPPIAAPPPPICCAGLWARAQRAGQRARWLTTVAPSTSRCRTTAPSAMSPAQRALCRRSARAARHAPPRLRPRRRRPCAADRRSISTAVRAAPGRGRGLHRRRHPRREQCRPGLPRRPALRRGRDPLSRPAAVRRRRDQQPRRAPSPRGWRRSRPSRCPPSSPSPRRAAAGSEIEPPQIMARGDAEAALAAAPHRLPGTLEMGGQEHFYLEGQAALATPGEAGPAPRRQLDPASERGPASDRRRCSACSSADVDRRGPPDGRRVRRQGDPGRRLSPPPARWSPRKTGRPAKIRADRDDDMVMTGKRHDFTRRL